MKHKKEWNSWRAMKEKCDNPNSSGYKYVGAKGITYDKSWADFKNFYRDMGDNLVEDGCLMRQDRALGYSKENCFWGTQGVRTPKDLRERYPKEYRAWKNLQRRCDCPGSSHYERYGGRGISVCERWREFRNFIQDMGERPSPKHSIDRIDNDGNYCPENCRWVTQSEQLFNSTKSIGKKVHEWDFHGCPVSRCTVYKRLQKGWSKEKALTAPSVASGSVNAKKVCCLELGKVYSSIAEAARIHNLHATGISAACKGVQQRCGGFHWRYID